MNQGVKTIIYPVEDLNRAKALFSKLLGVKPYSDKSIFRSRALCGRTSNLPETFAMRRFL